MVRDEADVPLKRNKVLTHVRSELLLVTVPVLLRGLDIGQVLVWRPYTERLAIASSG